MTLRNISIRKAHTQSIVIHQEKQTSPFLFHATRQLRHEIHRSCPYWLTVIFANPTRRNEHGALWLAECLVGGRVFDFRSRGFLRRTTKEARVVVKIFAAFGVSVLCTPGQGINTTNFWKPKKDWIETTNDNPWKVKWFAILNGHSWKYNCTTAILILLSAC